MSRWTTDEHENDPSDEEALAEELGGEWEVDPNDPSHPDHDLSETAGYAYWEPPPKAFYLRRGFILLVTVLVILGLTLPFIIRLTY